MVNIKLGEAGQESMNSLEEEYGSVVNICILSSSK